MERLPWNERIGWPDRDRAEAAADRLLARIAYEHARDEAVRAARRQVCDQCGFRRGLAGCRACRGTSP